MDKLQWGNRKLLRRVKMKDKSSNGKPNGGGGAVEEKAASRVVGDNYKQEGRDPPLIPFPHFPNRTSANDNRKAVLPSLLPEKEDRFHAKRGCNESSKVLSSGKEENQKIVWPRLLISLSSKEKEEDFMLMKGCKPSQRPKKRAKLIQRSILMVSPGAWLSDVCRERYEVREKKTCKKKPRGLKAMGGIDLDSE